MTPRNPSGPDAASEPGPRAALHVSSAGVELIKRFEGFRPRAARLPGDRYVVGYGHVRSAREGVEVTEADAHSLLVYDLLAVESAVNEWTFTPLSQNQFDALVSFAFNLGLKSFRGSNVLRRLNEGAVLQAAAALETWRQADLDGEIVVVDALVRRRAAEKALFLTPGEGHVPASGAVLRPRFDASTSSDEADADAEQLIIPLEGEVAVVTRFPGLYEALVEPALPAQRSPSEPEAAAEPELERRMAPEPAPMQPSGSESQPAPAPDPEPEPEPEPLNDAEERVAKAFSALDRLAADPVGSPIESGAQADQHDAADEPATPEEGDEDWSAARAAAAAVSARLQEILRNDDSSDEDDGDGDRDGGPILVLTSHPSPPESDLDPMAETLPEVEPFPVEALRGGPDITQTEYLEPFPAGEGAATTPAASGDGPSDDALLADLGAYERLPSSPGQELQPTGPYLLMGLVGLLFLIAALVSLFRSPAAGDAADGASLVSWVLGAIGIAGVAGALWLTLGREQIESDDQPTV